MKSIKIRKEDKEYLEKRSKQFDKPIHEIVRESLVMIKREGLIFYVMGMASGIAEERGDEQLEDAVHSFINEVIYGETDDDSTNETGT